MGRALEHDKKIDVLTWRIDKLEGDLKILAIALITSDTYVPEPEPEPVEEEEEYEDEGWEEEEEEEEEVVVVKKKAKKKPAPKKKVRKKVVKKARVPRETEVTIPKGPAKSKSVKKPELKRTEKEEKKEKIDGLLDNFFSRGRKR